MDRARRAVMMLGLSILAGCGARTASLADTSTIPAPEFLEAPASPADSPQLDALVLRETSGLPADEPDVDASLIGRLLDAVRAEHPEAVYVADVFATAGNAYVTLPDPDVPGRTISAHYRGDDGSLRFGEPRFNEGTAFFPISSVRPEAITALVDGLIAAYPALQVDMPRLDVALSYDLGLSWRVELNDARGRLAVLWADLDGGVIAVDLEDR